MLAAMTRYRWTPSRCAATPPRWSGRCWPSAACLTVVRYGALKDQPVQVVLSRPVGAPDGYQLALVTTDLAAIPRRSSNATPTAGPKSRITANSRGALGWTTSKGAAGWAGTTT